MDAVTRAASISALLALVLAAAWFFWPSGLGGGTTFVATHGNSMEPRFRTGDLAILRPAASYSVGDVVAYYSPSLGTIVMHRIVSGDASGFVTQGDDNDWLDTERPSQEEILGRLFLRIPRGGQALDTLRSPGALGMIAAGLLTVLGSAYRPPGRTKARGSRRRGRRRSPALSMPARARARQVALGAGAVTLLAAVGCGVLLTLPPTHTQSRTVQVTQEGQFSYTGSAVPGTTYPSGVITTGDPVWTRLVRDLSVTFTSTVTGPGVAGVTGAVQLDVVVTAADGWTAVLASGPAAAFQGGTATATVPIDADAAAELLTSHYDEIGTAGGSATLTVTPEGQASGTVQGLAFTTDSIPGLAFALDGTSLRPSGAEDELAPSNETPVHVDEVVPRSLTVLDLSVPIGVVRKIAGGILLTALVVLGVAALVGRTGRGDVADQFLVRHADRILPVAAFTPGANVIDVSDAESLHRVAERFDTLVLHHAREDEDVFAVRDVDATYRFVVPGSPDRRRGKPPVPVPASPSAAEPEPAAPQPAAVPVPEPTAGLWDRVA